MRSTQNQLDRFRTIAKRLVDEHSAEVFTRTAISSEGRQNVLDDVYYSHLDVLGKELNEQAEQFISVLADERRLVETEIKQRGLEPFTYPMEGIVFTVHNSVFEPGNTGERLKEAADYNRRIHARAKGILNPQQLAAFEQMQEAAIVGIKYWLRQQERDLATRTATSGEKN